MLTLRFLRVMLLHTKTQMCVILCACSRLPKTQGNDAIYIKRDFSQPAEAEFDFASTCQDVVLYGPILVKRGEASLIVDVRQSPSRFAEKLAL